MLINQTNDRERIALLQRMLRWLSHLYGLPALSVSVTGAYNPQTREAVRAFQEWAGIPATGICGRETWERLVSLCRRESSQLAPVPILSVPDDPDFCLKPGSSSEAVRTLQMLLGELGRVYGFDPVPVPGEYDPATDAAVRHYRRSAGMDEEGGADREMWHRLAEEARQLLS